MIWKWIRKCNRINCIKDKQPFNVFWPVYFNGTSCILRIAAFIVSDHFFKLPAEELPRKWPLTLILFGLFCFFFWVTWPEPEAEEDANPWRPREVLLASVLLIVCFGGPPELPKLFWLTVPKFVWLMNDYYWELLLKVFPGKLMLRKFLSHKNCKLFCITEPFVLIVL